jgi:hypothetical protein
LWARIEVTIFFILWKRIIQRINGWKEKLLSIGGKEILLKAVAQAIPVYAMSVFQIPKGVCKLMMDAISQFWWGDDDNSNKMHWLAWWKLCYPKKEGGMGFRDFHSFNLAMLAKQIWPLVNEPNSLCARVLKAKYYPHGDILKAGPKAGSSFTWQSILAGLPTFKRYDLELPSTDATDLESYGLDNLPTGGADVQLEELPSEEQKE